MSLRVLISAVVVACAGWVAWAQERVESALCRASVVGEIETGDRVDDLLADGSVMYALSGDELRVYSLDDPTEPVLVRAYGLDDVAVRLWLHDDRLYVVGRSVIRVFDAQDAANLIELNALDFGYTDASSYRFVGHRVFLAGDFLGLLSFDFTDVMNPVRSEVAARNPGTGPSVLELVGSRLVYGLSFDSMVYDISDSSSIDLIDDFGLFVGPRQSASDGFYLYRAGVDEQTLESGLLVYDVADPLEPVLVSSLPIDADSVESIASAGLVLMKRRHAVEVVDVSDPLEPVWVGSYGTDAFAFDASAVSGGYVYVTPRNRMQVIDTGMMGVSWVGGAGTQGLPVDVAVEGDHALVLDTFLSGQGWSGLNTFDLSDAGSPVLLDNVQISGYSRRLAVRWPIVYVASLYNGLVILDVSDPSDIRARGTMNLWDQYFGETIDVCVSGGFAYVANTHRLVVIDIADPDVPTIVDELEVSAECVHAAGGYLFVTTGADELLMYGMGGSGVLTLIDAIGVEGIELGAEDAFPRDMALVEDRLYIPSTYSGVVEFTVDAQDGLGFVRVHDLVSPELSLRVEDEVVYTTAGGVGQAHRIEADGGLSYAGSFSSSSRIGRFALRDGLAFVTGPVFGHGRSGVSVLDLETRCVSCVADFNGDGELSYFDVAALLVAYAAGDPSADLNGDGSIDFLDISAFVVAYGGGCD
ncbi:MAG: GC-type dockerin domain-anchored protein [Phycisphaerales bacterium JB047]